MENIRVRFAPSPTGYLHVGGARTALFNYLFAKSHNGKYILRIEDTDQKRSTDDATKQVLESLKWLGLEWDEGPEVGGEYGPYFQSQRLDIYKKYADKLLEQGKAYRCFCTEKELEIKAKRREAMGLPPVYDGKCSNLTQDEINDKLSKNMPYTIRFKVPQQEIYFDDIVRGRVKFDTKLIGDFIIVKSDGFPSYNFAVVIDDALMKINYILRGDDHISNTPRQIMIYNALGFELPTFGHISMILGPDKQKLSKRHGATSLLEFKEKGYLPEALINYIALLGWSPEDGVELIKKETLKKVFSEKRLNSSPAVFDYTKLDYINGYYIRNNDEEEIFNLFKPFLIKGNYLKEQDTDENIKKYKKIVHSLKGYCKKGEDILEYIKIFDEKEITEEQKQLIQTEDAEILFSEVKNKLSENQGEITNDEFSSIYKYVSKEKGIKGKNFYMPLRLKITGMEHGVELTDVFNILGRDEIIKRLSE